MAKAKPDVWTLKHVTSLAPDAASIPAAQKVLKKGGFGTVEATADGRGWWVVCRGLTDTYQVTVRRDEKTLGQFDYSCNCLSYKLPCKHALALLMHLVEHPEERAEVEAPRAAASDFEGLLRGAFREPDEDTPRLVFADFLEENDQPDRAALIRLQCEQARLKASTARSKELKELIKAVVARLKKQIGPLPVGITYQFRRGFMNIDGLGLLYLDPGALPARVTNLFRDGWVESVATAPGIVETSPEVLVLAAQVGELDVSPYPMEDGQLTRLVAETAEARTSGRLARLTVHGRNRPALDRLLRAERGEEPDPAADLEPVRHYQGLTARTFQQLLQFGRLNGARALHLYANEPLGAAEVTALLTADLRALRRLRLYNWKLGRPAVRALVTAPALARLTTLDLCTCRLNAACVAAVAGAPLYATLKALDLSGNAIGTAGVQALLDAPVPPKLKELVLDGYRLDAPEKRRLRAKFKTRLKV